MKHRTIQVTQALLSCLTLLCWIVMFLAGTDVWHAVGSPDIWRDPSVPFADVRVFAIAFYVSFALVTILLVFGIWGWRMGKKRPGPNTAMALST